MKINAIIGRGTRKDFIDLYVLLQHYFLSEILKGTSKNSSFLENSPISNIMALLYCFWFSLGILLTFIQSQCPHCSFTQVNNLLKIKLKISIKQFLEVPLIFTNRSTHSFPSIVQY